MEVLRQHPVIRSPITTNSVGESARNDSFGSWTGSGWKVIPERGSLATDTQNDGVVIDLGTGNYWMNLKGAIGSFGSFFRYSLSPSPAMLYNKDDTRRGYSPWEVANVSLLATTLDPNVRYTLTLENLNNNGWDTGIQELNDGANQFEIGSLELWNKDAVWVQAGTR
jgi:hypothetical protein